VTAYGHAWSAMGRHTPEFQRRWAALYPDIELHLVRANSATGGLAEGICDLEDLQRPCGLFDALERNPNCWSTWRASASTSPGRPP
jgi:hypothetical protein